MAGYNFQKVLYFFRSRLLPNRADLYEMPLDALFHPGLHCLQKFLFRGFQSTKGL